MPSHDESFQEQAMKKINVHSLGELTTIVMIF